jgi:hypothetical protein
LVKERGKSGKIKSIDFVRLMNRAKFVEYTKYTIFLPELLIYSDWKIVETQYFASPPLFEVFDLELLWHNRPKLQTSDSG